MTTAELQTKLVLTRDEVLALLQAMGAGSLNGMDPEPLKGLTEQEAVERLNGGAQTLLNRGLVEYEGADTLKIDSALLALVGSCVLPDATLLISTTTPDGVSVPLYLHATPSMMVEQSSPLSGVMSFEYVPDAPALNRRIQELVALAWANTTLADARPIELSDAALTDTLTRARGGDVAGAEQALIQAGADADSAKLCATALNEAILFTGLVAWGLRNETTPGSDSVIIVSSTSGNWLIDPVPHSSRLVVHPATGKECEAAMLALAGPLERVHARE